MSDRVYENTNLRGRDKLEEPGVDVRIIFRKKVGGIADSV
jgi:hypothetical protein